LTRVRELSLEFLLEVALLVFLRIAVEVVVKLLDDFGSPDMLIRIEERAVVDEAILTPPVDGLVDQSAVLLAIAGHSYCATLSSACTGD
jgi:hypothetical protein